MMDINKLAEEAIFLSGGLSLQHSKLMFCFNEGYKAATQWYPMEEAPKLPIQDIIIAIKCDDGRVGSGEGYWDSDYNYWVTATGEKIDDPIAWTHLPIYNPQNDPK